MATRAHDGLAGRVVRALRLDPTLYREVAAPGGGTWQAAVVVVIAAVISGLSWGALEFTSLGSSAPVSTDQGVVVAQSAVSIALAHIVAWPVWAFGLWAVGTSLGGPDRQQPWFGHIARAIAFAQAPAVLLMLYVLMVAVVGFAWGPEGLRSGVMWLTGFWLLVLAPVWVLAGTFLAAREALGLGNGRTLAALVTVGLAIGALVGFVVMLLSGIAGRDFVGLRDDYIAGFRDDGISAADFAVGLDFNLRFIGQSGMVLYILSKSALHPFVGVGDI